MLIPIENYIEQILPPTWRQPRYMGVARTLFQPIGALLEELYMFRIEAVFRAGLTGQKIILQHYLQNMVDGGISIQDENGVTIDFTVVVPQALSADKRKQVRDIVQAYKLAGKRFQLSNSIVPPPLPPSTLQWTPGFPKSESGVILLCVNTAGSYRTRVINNANGQTMLDTTRVYQANIALSLGEWPAGSYRVEVANLTGNVTVQQAGNYSLDITPVEKIPGDMNGAWRIVLVEAFRGVKNFNIKWYKGQTEISSYNVNQLDTNLVNFLYFNPKNNDPWKIRENGAGTYMVRVTTSDDLGTYTAVNTATFTNVDLGIEGDGGGGPIDPPPTGSAVVTIVNSKDFFVVQNQDGTFSDTKPSSNNDAIAFYFVEDVPMLNVDGTPRTFVNITLAAGEMYQLRKLWVNRNAHPTWSALTSQWWLENAQGTGTNNIYSNSVVPIRIQLP